MASKRYYIASVVIVLGAIITGSHYDPTWHLSVGLALLGEGFLFAIDAATKAICQAVKL